jgi:DNA-binding MarR family transcriptional regulator
MSESTDLLSAIVEIRDLVRLMAEPQIAARDQKLRDELIRIVGKGAAKTKAALLMNGAHNQTAIRAQTGINQGNLSTLVKELGKSKLLTGDPKQPKLAISIPSDFFEKVQEQ